MKKIYFILGLLVLTSLCFAQERPRWIDFPLSARANYDADRSGAASVWYFDVGMSQRIASESTARTRARENVQHSVAANIGTQITSRMDITNTSFSQASGVEDVDTLMNEVITRTIRTRVPGYEPLEWFIERGTQDGRAYFVAFVLIRIPRSEIITIIENINPEVIASEFFRQAGVLQENQFIEYKADIIQNFTNSKNTVVYNIINVLGSN